MLSGLEEAYTCTEVPEVKLRVELMGMKGKMSWEWARIFHGCLISLEQ